MKDATSTAIKAERWAIHVMLTMRAAKAEKAGFKRVAAVLRDCAEKVLNRPGQAVLPNRSE